MIEKKISIFNPKKLKIFKNKSKKVLCHGHFDLIHPGHLRFLEGASKKGNELIVAIYNDKYYVKNDLINHFKIEERAKNVATLVFVDKVIIIDPSELHSLISNVDFTYFFLGEEFKFERKFEVAKALLSAKKNKTKIIYYAGEKISFGNNFNSSQLELKNKTIISFNNLLLKEKIKMADVIKKITNKKQKNITVLGDVIIDKYISCIPLGLSEEAPLVVVKEMEEKIFLGGAGIVAKHIKKMGNNSSIISVLGSDENYSFVENDLKKSKIKYFLIKDSQRPTTIKTRYLVENQKMFRVSKLSEKFISEEIENKIIKKISLLKEKSILVLSDFVYGIITKKILTYVKKLKKNKKILLIGDLQCSSQFGDVSKFINFDLICATEKEARIATQDYNSGLERIANLLISKTKIKNLILKLGSDGFILYRVVGTKNIIDRKHFPALESYPIDLAGAGDTLLSAVSISLSAGLDIVEASAVASCASALAVQKLGNNPIKLSEISDYVNSNDII